MNKENTFTNPGRVIEAKPINISNWQVDEATPIPVREGRVVLPLALPLKRARHGQRFSLKAMLLIVTLGICSIFTANATQSVSVAWTPSTDPSTVGYIVYAGNSPTNYTVQLNVGTNTMVTLSGLTEGATIYVAVSAYNSANVVGTPSSPITYFVPGRITMASGSAAPGTLNFPVAPGHYYQIQVSSDLKNWTTVYQTPTATTNMVMSYTDANAKLFAKRFYRLIMH